MTMKKINTKQSIKTFSGLDLKVNGETLILGTVLEGCILSSQEISGLKKHSLCSKIYNDNEYIEVDDADFSLIKHATKKINFFRDEDSLNGLCEAYIANYFENLKDITSPESDN